MDKESKKQELRNEYLTNKHLIDRYLKNDNDFDSTFLKARKRNAEIVEYLRLVFKMDYDSILDFLK